MPHPPSPNPFAAPLAPPGPIPAAPVGDGGTSRYAWVIVGLLWICGFLNYADRQAVYSVFDPIRHEFRLSDTQLGMLGSSFAIVYALAAPFAGFVVDRASRKWLVVGGLAFWSLICAATATSQDFKHLLFFRAAEGLGEAFYFPASMSLLAAYHGSRTRSRAMSLHQTSVYVGTAAGGILSGYLGQWYGWRSPFWVLGLIGVVYAAWLMARLREPPRHAEEPGAEPVPGAPALRPVESESSLEKPGKGPGLGTILGELLMKPAAVALLVAFAGANFVAMAFLTWLPDFVRAKFGLELKDAAVVAALYLPAANLVGAMIGGVLADRAASRRAGGRARVQALGLFLGAPCIYLVGRTDSLSLLIAALVAIGLCKGVYDANIFASIYDVVRPEIRGTTAGLMNTVGWAAGSLAPLALGWAKPRFGLSAAIEANAGLYVVAGFLALLAAVLTARQLGGHRESAQPV